MIILENQSDARHLQVAVLDYGMGNIGSVLNMLRRVNIVGVPLSDPSTINDFRAIILPGVGNFDRAMDNLISLGMSDAIIHASQSQSKLILGICLGMQLLCNSSEEGSRQGLGLIDANVKRFRVPEPTELKVPHMGWNKIKPCNPRSRVCDFLTSSSKFYFVHSYYVECLDPKNVVATTSYGINFASMIQSGSTIGVQFHPEKSHVHGMRLLQGLLGSVI